MTRAHISWVLAACLLCCAVSALAAPAQEKERNWRFGLHGASTWNDQFDVFGRDLPLAGAVSEEGRGGGFVVGRMFGHRFLLDLQVTAAEHDIAGDDSNMLGSWALINGSVFFRNGHVLQPFVRGGFGGGGWDLQYPEGQGHVLSFGTAAILGVGLSARLSPRFSLELEGLATFTNHLEVDNESDVLADEPESWKVRASSQGWRLGLGLSFWF
jgi:opacity protein-like surface antigen